MGLVGRLPPSDRVWQTAQPFKGAAEQVPPGPVLWEMQGETARRAREPSDRREVASSEGLGGHHPLPQADAGTPAGQVVRQALHRQPGCVCGEASRWQMVESHTILQVADGVLDLGVSAMVSLQPQGVALSICDEGVIAVACEQCQLGAGSGPDPSDDEAHRCWVGSAVEGDIRGLGHVCCSVHPVGYGRPVAFGYGLYEVAQSPVLAYGDGEADIVVATDRDDVAGVEAAVGAHGELSARSCVAHPSDRLTQEVRCAAGGVGPPLSEPCHQHVSGCGGDGQQRVIAPLTAVVVAARSLLAQSVGLADGGVKVYGQWLLFGTRPGVPGTRKQLPAHPVQLAHMSPAEAAQEGPQSGRRLDRTAQHPLCAAGAQSVRVVYAVSTCQSRCHQGHQLVARIRPTRCIPQVEVAIDQFAQTQASSEGNRQDQPGIGYQAVVVECDTDAVGVLA